MSCLPDGKRQVKNEGETFSLFLRDIWQVVTYKRVWFSGVDEAFLCSSTQYGQFLMALCSCKFLNDIYKVKCYCFLWAEAWFSAPNSA